MAIKDLIPWNNKGREVGMRRSSDIHPFFTLHREMNRMFDDVAGVVQDELNSLWYAGALDEHQSE